VPQAVALAVRVRRWSRPINGWPSSSATDAIWFSGSLLSSADVEELHRRRSQRFIRPIDVEAAKREHSQSCRRDAVGDIAFDVLSTCRG
jgi:hypothetical protein